MSYAMENFSEKKITETSFRGAANKLDIIFENEKFIAVNKPSGLLIHYACREWLIIRRVCLTQ